MRRLTYVGGDEGGSSRPPALASAARARVFKALRLVEFCPSGPVSAIAR